LGDLGGRIFGNFGPASIAVGRLLRLARNSKGASCQALFKLFSENFVKLPGVKRSTLAYEIIANSLQWSVSHEMSLVLQHLTHTRTRPISYRP
jgi:hypothetical protein